MLMKITILWYMVCSYKHGLPYLRRQQTPYNICTYTSICTVLPHSHISSTKGEGKSRPVIYQWRQRGEAEVQLHLCLTSAVDGWVVHIMPLVLHSLARGPSSHWTRGWLGAAAGLDRYGKNFSLSVSKPPDHAGCSKSLHWVFCPSPSTKWYSAHLYVSSNFYEIMFPFLKLPQPLALLLYFSSVSPVLQLFELLVFVCYCSEMKCI